MQYSKIQTTITVICFAIAVICVVALFPLTAHIISLPSEAIGTPSYENQWLIACTLGIVGLVSAMTGQRLSKKLERK